MRTAMHDLRRLIAAPALEGIITGRFGANAAANTDDEIDQFLRNYSSVALNGHARLRLTLPFCLQWNAMAPYFLL